MLCDNTVRYLVQLRIYSWAMITLGIVFAYDLPVRSHIILNSSSAFQSVQRQVCAFFNKTLQVLFEGPSPGVEVDEHKSCPSFASYGKQ